MTRIGRLLLAGFVVGLLGGCGGDEMEDLKQFMAQTHAGRKPAIEPLPEIKPQENFKYDAANLADPFAPVNLKPQIASAGGPRPDMNRRREPLEDYPLDALKMVGTLSRGRQSWVVLMAPDGTVHRAGVGSHVGQNFGTITKITEEKLDVVELVQGALGDWIERTASVALAE